MKNYAIATLITITFAIGICGASLIVSKQRIPFTEYDNLCTNKKHATSINIVHLEPSQLNSVILSNFGRRHQHNEFWIKEFQNETFGNRPMYVQSALDDQKPLKVVVLLSNDVQKLRNRRSLCFRKEELEIGGKRKRPSDEKDGDESESSTSTVSVETVRTASVDDYIFQDPELEAKFFSLHCSRKDLHNLSKLDTVGIFNWTIKSLALGIFWFYRVGVMLNKGYCSRPRTILLQKFEDFPASINSIGSFAELGRDNSEELKELDQLLPIIKEFVHEAKGKIAPKSFEAIYKLFTHAIKEDPANIPKACLAFSLEAIHKDVNDELPWGPLYSFRLFSVHNSEPKAILTFEDWWYLFKKGVKCAEYDETFSNFVLRMVGAHGPNYIRKEVLKLDLKSQVLEPLLLNEQDQNDLDPDFFSNDWIAHFNGKRRDEITIDIPEVDLMQVDSPEFDNHSGVFKMTDKYVSFVQEIEEFINSGYRSDLIKIEVFKTRFKGGSKYVDVRDVGGMTRSFLTSFGCLFKVHPYVLVESARGSVALHPMASEQVYAFLANLFGLLALYNYKDGRSTPVSINWFLNPPYAEFMFDPNLERIPTIEEIHLFFPHLQEEFEVCCTSPEYFGSHYDLRHEITMTSIINHINVHHLGGVIEPRNVEELKKQRNNYIEFVQLKVHQGHIAFIQNLHTYFDNHYCDYENFDLLFVRRNLLTANEVIRAIEISDSCLDYLVRYEDNEIHNLKEAFPRMVREMSHSERDNLFHFGLGGVPTIFSRKTLTVYCLYETTHPSQSWSASSCAGSLHPPKRSQEAHGPIDYKILYDALIIQSKMDYGSTSGNENWGGF